MMDKNDLKKIFTHEFKPEWWSSVMRNVFNVQTIHQKPVPIHLNANDIATDAFELGHSVTSDERTIGFYLVNLKPNVWLQRNRIGVRNLLRSVYKYHVDGAIVVFSQSNNWRLSFISEIKVLDEGQNLTRKETHPKRFTYLLGTMEKVKTPVIQLSSLINKPLALEDVRKAFSVEALNKDFYLDYKNISVKIIRYIHPNQISNKLKAHQGALNLLNRVMFIHFIQKKKWLMDDPEFLINFWNDYRAENKGKDEFHKYWINKLFFKAFNGKAFNDPEIFKKFPAKYHTKILSFPFLNGGLFTFHDEFDDFLLPDALFEDIFNFLQQYNFTIDEASEEEVDLEINPELLGKMYEGMINATDLDDVEAEHGIVYTERPEINFMARRSFVEVLDKKLPGKYSREFYYHFCFDPPEEKVKLIKYYKVDIPELRAAVLSITALDPACGSGSMLLGVIQLQLELIRCLDEVNGMPHNPVFDFQLKKQIISECIYGVDIKEWAVRIAELRLWLYMIAEAEFTVDELTKSPLLPNLDFKLRQGNSLIQEIGNLDFSIKGLFKGRKKDAGATRKLKDFIKKKKEFITNQNESETSFDDLKKEEIRVFREFIAEMIHSNNQLIKNYTRGDGQIGMFGHEKKNIFEQQLMELEDENEKLRKVLSSIKDTGRLPFSFDIDFMEIFLTRDDPGFDLVIGNPPYVKQEDILPADDALELERLLKPENKEEKTEVSKYFKEKLSAKVLETYPFLTTKAQTQVEGKTKKIDVYGSKVPGRSDLYVYFQLICPSLLNEKGTFCFIISNSWLDVDYGSYVQQFLLKHTNLIGIYDSTVRSFTAGINTIIYLHGSPINLILTPDQYKILIPQENVVRFIMNKDNYTNAAFSPLLIEQEHCQKNTFWNHYRVIIKNAKELWYEGYNEESQQYQCNKWGGQYLRAPEIFFTILERNGDRFLKLKDIADVLPGCYAGIADFFYVNRDTISKFNIESEYLIPLLRNSDCIDKLRFSETGWFVIYCREERTKIKQGLKSYIEWGEKQVTRKRQKTNPGIPYPQTESVKNRIPGWWAISENNIRPTDLFMQYVSSNRFYCPISINKIASDRSFHRIFTNNESLKYYLNSSLTWFFALIMGRSNLGEGALKFEKSDAMKLRVLDLKSLKFDDSIFNRAPLEIMNELGFEDTITIRKQKPNPLLDRRNLDNLIFDELGLTEDERNEVYWATAELVKQRLDKAGTR